MSDSFGRGGSIGFPGSISGGDIGRCEGSGAIIGEGAKAGPFDVGF